MKICDLSLAFVLVRAAPSCRLLVLGSFALLAHAPALHAQTMALSDRAAAPVIVETANVSTEITGRYAVTTFDLVFRNPNSRALEGTFEFPLLDGQNVIRFALDIGGSLREAVPVEKEKGRVTFEEIARRGVDPALLEQTAGNNYRARVFPLPARGTRRIVIAYQEALRPETDGTAKFRLPLAFGGKVHQFELNLTVRTGSSTPALARTTLPLELPAWDATRSLRVARRDFAAQGMIELTLPKAESESL
ncbi:MAG TPA: VIT domain-containing protein, partial [Opitutaceae bacterium]|nr:VIT domain-containing protein [Opitutaceae bacterium]